MQEKEEIIVVSRASSIADCSQGGIKRTYTGKQDKSHQDNHPPATDMITYFLQHH
jgi:hypothetical protein